MLEKDEVSLGEHSEITLCSEGKGHSMRTATNTLKCQWEHEVSFSFNISIVDGITTKPRKKKKRKNLTAKTFFFSFSFRCDNPFHEKCRHLMWASLDHNGSKRRASVYSLYSIPS